MGPHDKLFKLAFTDVEEAAALLRALVPERLAGSLDGSTLKVVKGSFVDAALRERHTDILYEAVSCEGQLQLVYVLLEHQSTVDWMMAVRVHGYVGRVWAEWRARHAQATTLPRVLPVVVYAGERPWTAPTKLEALVDGESTPWTPRFSFILDDLSRVEEAEVAQRSLGIFGELTLRALKQLPRSADPLADLTRWLPLLRRMLRADRGLDRLAAIIEYLARVADLEPEALQPVVRQLGPAAEETAMTLAERLRQQGIEQGLERGIERGTRDVILRLLALKFGELPAAVRSKVEAGAEADLHRWTERVLQASTLDQVFDDSLLG